MIKPLVFSVWFCKLDIVNNAAQKVISEKLQERSRLRQGGCSIHDCLKGDYSAGSGLVPFAIAFTPVGNESVSVFVSNAQDGWFTMVNCMQAEAKEDCIYITISEDLVNFPINGFVFFENGEEVRVVQSMKDPKWTFYERGKIQSFEMPSLYSKRKISDRMNRSIVIDYCKKLGINVCDQSFWQPKGNCLIFEPVGQPKS